MEKDSAALLLLLFVLVLAMAGVMLFVSGSSRRAALAERGRGGGDEAGVKRLRQSVDARLRRTGSGQKLGNWLQGAGSPLSPGDLLLLCFSGIVFATIALGLFMPRFAAFVLGTIATLATARILVERKRGRRTGPFDLFTFRIDLTELTRTLTRWRGHRAVQELQAELLPMLR